MDRGFQGGKGGTANPSIYAYEGQVAPGSNTAAQEIVRIAHYHHFSLTQSGRKFMVGDPAMAASSGFEYRRGLRAKPGAAVIMLGGGLPPQVMLIPKDVILQHKIKDGPYSKKTLQALGFNDDEGHIPGTTSTWSPDGFAKEALQKYFLWRAQQLSLGEGVTGIVPASPRKPIRKLNFPGMSVQ